MKEGAMKKEKISIFFLLLIGCTGIWTIYSHFFKEEKREEETMTENEFIDFLYQHLGMEEMHEFEDDEEHLLETSYQPMDLEATDFKLKTINHGTIKLSDFKGKKILLNFWTSWCPPCKEEMPQLNDFYVQEAKKLNVEILAVNITDQEISPEDVNDFSEEYQLQFPVLLDEQGEVSKRYQVLTIPTSFIISEDGRIIEKIIGPVTKDALLEKFP
ncbi:TlpA family protein disulfide reductase [Ureibacillus thermophilus]|uniref:TlpA family protein disulfide reductase n=2 Tax=Ureibacillus thermophilus TaxID=367743 RepID=A0A4P6UW52_9BACL|nr:TlpA family protein disulfide reductase [Ureibacillus thermophilus]